jgi:hypothetical protein
MAYSFSVLPRKDNVTIKLEAGIRHFSKHSLQLAVQYCDASIVSTRGCFLIVCRVEGRNSLFVHYWL